MVELVTPNEKIRDLTAAPRHIPIQMEGSVVFEVILSIWTTFDPSGMNTSQFLGADFHARLKDLTPDDLKEEIAVLGGPHCAVWLGIAGLFVTAPHPHEPRRLFEWLEEMAPMRLRRWLLGYASHNGSASLIEQAASGDVEALGELLCEKEGEYLDQLLTFFAIPDDELPRRLAGTLRRFYQEVFTQLDIDFVGAVERAAAARKSVAGREDAKTAIEEATQGLDYDIPVGVGRVVLIPSVVVKPLSVIDQHRDALIVYYGMADEFIDTDPEAPPSWLVNTYKALSDEKRLRILRRLSEGDTTLDELTGMLGLSKSTVHHHMSILRSAGLVRIKVPTEKKDKQRTYSLRDQILGDTSGFLNSYLTTHQLEVDHA